MRRAAAIGGRYGAATLGPLSVSVAHFLASLALLRALPPAEFGLFAFMLVVVQFCFGLSNALVATPFTVAANQREFGADAARLFFKANLVFCAAAGLACGGVAYAMQARAAAPLFGLFAGLATLRWFARAHAYALHAPTRAAISDFAYAGLLLAGLALSGLGRGLTTEMALAAFVAAAAAGVAMFGLGYFRAQFVEAFSGRLRAYASVWRDQSRWTLLGVTTTEATANAHAYLVTLVAGPAAFAPLAAAALFLRPVGLCANSLTQLERPAMTRAIATGDAHAALHAARRFRWAMMGAWLVTVAAAAVVLVQFPAIILKESYDPTTVMLATAFWAAIAALQAWRAPDSALLQAADRFRPLAGASVRSSVVAILGVLALLLAFGPIASLGGVLVGQGVMAWYILRLMQAWRREHG